MAQLLKPTRPRKRVRLPVTLATWLVPVLGLLVILNAAPVRSPLTESEAPLALAARYPEKAEIFGPELLHLTTANVALASLAPGIVGSTEFELRLLGLAAGLAALGALVRLGERLFSTRVGVLAAVLLVVTPAGQKLLGAELSPTPFYIILTFIALAATRSLAVSRASGVHAGLAMGAAVALVGPRALWLLLSIGVWLWKLRGLTPRNLGTIVGAAVVGSVGTALLSAGFLTALRPGPLPPLLLAPFEDITPHDLRSAVLSLLYLLPATPIIALGVHNRPRNWLWRGSPRFLATWLLGAALEMLFSGHWQSLFAALTVTIAVPCIWAVENAARRTTLLGMSSAAVIALVLAMVAPGEGERQLRERWAARETARFVRRSVPADDPVFASDEIRGRIAYYARRTTRSESEDGFEGRAFIVSPRSRFTTSRAAMSLPRSMEIAGANTRILAEIGPYVLSRTGEVVPPGAAPPAVASPRSARTALIDGRTSANAMVADD